MTRAARLFLDAWAEARPQAPACRAASLLTSLGGEKSPEKLPIGVRDRRLLELLAGVAGTEIFGVVKCDSCGADLEVAAPIAAFVSSSPVEPLEVEIEGERIAVRAPTTHDIMAASAAPDPSRRLAEICTARAKLDEDDAERVGSALLASDPLLDPQIDVTCPHCGAETIFGFDVGSFLWAHVEGRAHQLMSQVHLIAHSYGWTEDEILALPETRRAAYLELLAR